eukprot:CAMPEP_0206364120 /NCGR_PEP_ID=MMETSP0294-20121207/2016_1 /ASSEMBLY_ACC=CAM_ASM_000327 /TAXON_ID=39354 /ORGANISM="Heterosigma akashiwo, Strain CCMP2393" /LENGTH=174 /DNA_ID=CAMNT_0053809631 /DNA_START=91 /DNA_END=614 /DNA_ORIENTATION=-
MFLSRLLLNRPPGEEAPARGLTTGLVAAPAATFPPSPAAANRKEPPGPRLGVLLGPQAQGDRSLQAQGLKERVLHQDAQLRLGPLHLRKVLARQLPDVGLGQGDRPEVLRHLQEEADLPEDTSGSRCRCCVVVEGVAAPPPPPPPPSIGGSCSSTSPCEMNRIAFAVPCASVMT